MTPPALRGIRAAFIFMSRIPLGGFPYSKDDFRWAPAHFPFVGLCIGVLGALPFFLVPVLGAPLCAALSLALTIWTTGAFHEDGLADSADALGGAHSRKKLHEILKDSRIGTYGASALILSLVIRIFALVEIARLLSDVSLLSSFLDFAHTPPSIAFQLIVVLAFIHALARTGPVALMTTLPYVAGEGAKGSSIAKGGQLPQFVVALFWAALACIGAALGGVALTLLFSQLLLTIVISLWMRLWFKKRAGGFTGDFLGATEQVLEMVLLLCTVAYLKTHA